LVNLVLFQCYVNYLWNILYVHAHMRTIYNHIKVRLIIFIFLFLYFATTGTNWVKQNEIKSGYKKHWLIHWLLTKVRWNTMTNSDSWGGDRLRQVFCTCFRHGGLWSNIWKWYQILISLRYKTIRIFIKVVYYSLENHSPTRFKLQY